MTTAAKEKVWISKEEYARLKKIDGRFRHFWTYLEHLLDIREARGEIKRGKFVSQEKLFKHLGF